MGRSFKQTSHYLLRVLLYKQNNVKCAHSMFAHKSLFLFAINVQTMLVLKQLFFRPGIAERKGHGELNF